MPPQTKKDQNQNDEPQVPLTEASPDVQVADKSGLTEGEVHALRKDAGFDQLPGHEPHVLAWEASAAGQEFVKGEKDRNKEAEEGAKSAHDVLDKDDQTEAEKKYREVTSKKK